MKNDKKYNDACDTTMLLNRMINNCNRITQELNRLMKQELSLTLAKYEVLLAIKKSDGGNITMSNLSRELSVSNANMTGMTSRLLKDGLIEKKAFPRDRRIFSVKLSDKGNNTLEQAMEKQGRWIKEVFQNIDVEEVSLANSFLDKLDRDVERFSNNN